MTSLPKPQKKIELFSGNYFAACTLGGIIGIFHSILPKHVTYSQLTSLPACGPTHTAVTPLDLVKCRRQVDSKLYSSNFQAWRTIMAKEGLRGVFFGWVRNKPIPETIPGPIPETIPGPIPGPILKPKPIHN
jgi:solute carrier family 25 phosphate transporter 3